MNPDIQRIAEKLVHDTSLKGIDISLFIAALAEISALRDTQESKREREFEQEKKGWIDAANEQARVSKGHALQLLELRAELARRDEVEKELREVVDSWDGSGAGSAYGVAGKVKRILRSRIGELEGKLSEKT